MILLFVVMLGAWWAIDARKTQLPKLLTALDDLSPTLGFKISPIAATDLDYALREFPLEQNSERYLRYSQLWEQTRSSLTLRLFTAGYPEHTDSPPVFYTVCWISGLKSAVPQFCLHPDTIESPPWGPRSGATSLLRSSANSYVLNAVSPTRTQNLFSSDLLTQLDKFPHVSIEGSPSGLLFYEWGRQLDASELPPFVEHAYTIASNLDRQA